MWHKFVFLTHISLLFLLFAIFTSEAGAQTWISSVSATTTTNQAIVRWITAVPADSQIKWGKTTGYGSRNGRDPLLLTTHAMTISGLSAGMTYHFRVMSTDASGAMVTSMDYSFGTASGVIAVSVTPFTATISSGGTQQFTASVTNCADKSVTWSSTTGSVNANGLFTAPNVTADTTVTVKATSVTDPTKSASATVIVKAPAPALSVTPPSLSFSAQQGGSDPAWQTVDVRNTGGGTLTFSASTDAAWLRVSPASGNAPATLQVNAAIAGLVPGTYTGHVTVTAPGASGSPKTISVSFSVTSPPIAHSVDLNWNASTSSNVVSYSAYRGTSNGGPYELLASAITGLRYTDRTVVAGMKYYYVVTAVDDSGLESAFSSEAVATVPSP
ncbi:MAG TPA: hypothetical protein VHR84_13270 [Terriglobales bacterium]|jgi:Viral BACON domain|nr:hypothetical protein [Terriglobales bacterium]